jgi:prophage antirepressor-like protein
MNTNVRIFENPQFGNVRIVMDESDEPMFIAVDVAAALGYLNPKNAVATHCKTGKALKQGVAYVPHSNGFGGVNMTTINEGNLYRLVMRSDLPSAEDFQDWVCGEVLPSIRKTGGYIIASQEDTPELIMARALLVAQETINRQKQIAELAERTIKEQAPKVEYYEKVIESKGLLTVNMIASYLGITHIKLNKFLCGQGIQYKQSETYFLYEKYRDCGYAVQKPFPYTDSHGEMRTRQHLYWTEKGKAFILRLYSQNMAINTVESGIIKTKRGKVEV